MNKSSKLELSNKSAVNIPASAAEQAVFSSPDVFFFAAVINRADVLLFSRGERIDSR
jgi:hypothetical protein